MGNDWINKLWYIRTIRTKMHNEILCNCQKDWSRSPHGDRERWPPHTVWKHKLLPWLGAQPSCSVVPHTKGCRFELRSGLIREVTYRLFSLASMFFPLSEINKHILGWGFKKNKLLWSTAKKRIYSTYRFMNECAQNGKIGYLVVNWEMIFNYYFVFLECFCFLCTWSFYLFGKGEEEKEPKRKCTLKFC